MTTLLSLLNDDVLRMDGSGGDEGRDVQFRRGDQLDLHELKSFTGRMTPARRQASRIFAEKGRRAQSNELEAGRAHRPDLRLRSRVPADAVGGDLGAGRGLRHHGQRPELDRPTHRRLRLDRIDRCCSVVPGRRVRRLAGRRDVPDHRRRRPLEARRPVGAGDHRGRRGRRRSRCRVGLCRRLLRLPWGRVPDDGRRQALALPPGRRPVHQGPGRRPRRSADPPGRDVRGGQADDGRRGDGGWPPRASRPAPCTWRPTPPAPGVFFAGTDGGGVYRSDDGGATWSPFNGPGLRDHRVETVAVDPDGSTLFAGTIFGGLFRTSL